MSHFTFETFNWGAVSDSDSAPEQWEAVMYLGDSSVSAACSVLHEGKCYPSEKAAIDACYAHYLSKQNN